MAQLSGFKSPTIVTGSSTSVAVNTSNEVVVWGSVPPGSGQPALTDAVSVQTNYFCIIALKSDGTVVAWGDNNYGQLDVPAGLSGVVQISMGAYHCLALKSDGTVVAWGTNNGGQATVPAGLSGVTQVSAGGNTSFALKSDGSLEGWGSNGNFQLNIPAGIGAVTQVSVAESVVFAIIDDGTVEAWGKNTTGQRDVPASVSSPAQVEAANGYGMALQGGGVIMWGDTSYGLDSPPSSALSNVVYIAANSQSGDRAMCLLDDGTVVMWGRNAFGEGAVPAGLTALAPGVPPHEASFSASVSFSAAFVGKQIQIEGSFSAPVPITAQFTGFDNWLGKIPPAELQELYLFKITGSADGLPDREFKIANWQATNQAGNRQSYLQAVIPAADGLIEDIEARQSGELVISKGYRFSDGTVKTSEILRSNFDTLRYDRSGRNFTVTVSGYLSGKQSQNAVRALTGIRTLSVSRGKHRVRCDVDLFLQPGMTVIADEITFTADYINYFVSETDKFFEVSER